MVESESLMIDIKNIVEASQCINPVFLHSPQYQSISLSQLFGLNLICKVETINPIGCFKGRGVDWWMFNHQNNKKIVCVSAGNFGLAMAYSAKRYGIEVHVFSIEKANPIKMQMIKNMGAHIHLMGDNYDFVREEAQRYAEIHNWYLIVDGKEIEITEGAGTIGMELSKFSMPFEALYIPIADGALITGIATWYKAKSPQTKIIGVCAQGAPSMQLSWKAGRVVSSQTVNTIADGIAINTPIKEAFDALVPVIDEILLVDDAQIVHAMKLLYDNEHIVTEPAGATALAAAIANADNYKNKTVGIIITGSNINVVHREKWLNGRL